MSTWHDLTAERQRVAAARELAKAQLNAFPDIPAGQALINLMGVLNRKIAYQEGFLGLLTGFIEPEYLPTSGDLLKRLNSLCDNVRQGDDPRALLAQHDDLMLELTRNLGSYVFEKLESSQVVARLTEAHENARHALHNLKGQLRREVEALTEQLAAQAALELEWATASQENLDVFVAAEPTRAAVAQKRFRQRWPHIACSACTAPVVVQDLGLPPSRSRRRRKQERAALPDQTNEQNGHEDRWTLVLTNDNLSQKWRLSTDMSKAKAELDDHLQRLGIRGVKSGLVLERLRIVIGMSREERQHLRQTVDVPPIAWKLKRIPGFCILFEACEAKREIQFLVRPWNGVSAAVHRRK